MKVRILAFDYIKLFAMFLVIWGHCIALLSSKLFSAHLFLFIYSFHMPLFMMVAGFFFTKSEHKKVYKFVKGKFLRLIVPCLSWGLIISGTNLWLKGGGLNLDSIMYLFNALNVRFWFLRCLFICFCLIVLSQDRWGGYVFVLLLSQTTTYCKIDIMFPCFILGIILSKKYEWFRLHIRMVALFSVIIFVILYWLYFTPKALWTHDVYYTSTLPLFFLKNIDVFQYRLIRFAVGVSGSVFFISIFLIFWDSYKNESLSQMGQMTLGMYILQSVLIESILCKIVQIDNSSFLAYNFIITPLISVVVLSVSVQIIRFIRRNSMAAIMLLGESSKKTTNHASKYFR